MTMTKWTARVEWIQHGEPGTEQLDTWVDALAEHSGAIAGAPDRGEVDAYWSAVISLEAATLRQAIAAAVTIVEKATGVKAAGVEVLPEDEHDRRALQPLIPDLVGYVEIADLAGVSRQRARQFHTDPSPGFPAPVVETGSGPLFLRTSVEHWVAQRHPGKGGRPVTKVTA